MDWGPVGVIGGLILTTAGFLWKVRRDELADLKTFITEAVGPLREEIDRLRKWKHDFGQKEMVYDDHGRRIELLEDRVTDLERKK